jgi:hypothetical protein
MSFPILRADLQDPASPKLDLSSVTLPESSTFVEKRVLTLSKQVTTAAAAGKKSVNVSVVIKTNVEPVSAGLKVNFPDVTFTVEGSKDNAPAPHRGSRGERPTKVVVNWE